LGSSCPSPRPTQERIWRKHEFESAWEETVYLLRSLRNAARLLKVIENLDAGGGVERQLIE